MHLRSVVGIIELRIGQGQDPQDRHWGCPIRERWGLGAHQEMSPALEEKLAFTAALAGSYSDVALLAENGAVRWTTRSPVCVGRRTAKLSLGRTLAKCLIGGSVKMHPTQADSNPGVETGENGVARRRR
jgi:hypothetical protein